MTLNLRSPSALLALGRQLRERDYRFTTVTPATHRRVNRRPENAWAQDLRGALGWSRPWREGALPAEIEKLLVGSGLCEHVDRGGDSGRRATVRASSIGQQLYFHSAWPTDDEN